MTPEPEQNAPEAPGTAGSKTAGSKTAGAKTVGAKITGSKPRAGVPVWRTGKPDAVLAAAVDTARTAVEGIAPAEQIGKHLGAKSEGDRLVTHLFESRLAGYGGWRWYAVLTRNSRSKAVTVDELGLLPSEDAILAPEWVPWAERVRPGDEQEAEAPAEAAATASRDQGSGTPDAEGGADEEAAEGDAAPEDDSDDADGNADGAGDEYDADDVDNTESDDEPSREVD